jgi:probable HAF family extracellular repeat protein
MSNVVVSSHGPSVRRRAGLALASVVLGLALLVPGAAAWPRPGLPPAVVRAAAAGPTARSAPSGAPTYTLIDVGTFGGPNAGIDYPAVPVSTLGAVLGNADTTTADADYPNAGAFGSDPQIAHAFAWQNGQLRDLGALPGNNSSAVFEMNLFGVAVGVSETGTIDPLTGAPAQHSVLFKDGHVIDLGTLPGGTEGFAVAINDRGQVAGMGNNGVTDPLGGFPNFFPWVTETRGFIWQGGVMRDLGTLGGSDTIVATINVRGQIAGDSVADNAVNAATGLPTVHPYLWANGRMQDLGTLGGTFETANWLNDLGEVVGTSNLAGDQAWHPYLWDGQSLRDLGTLGGSYGGAFRINDRGDVTGWATPPGDTTAHAFLWRRGVMTDLTGVGNDECTIGEWVNDLDQVVGHDCAEGTALLWSNGHEYDLNALAGASRVELTQALFIDDRGEIAALGDFPNGSEHVFLLRPRR